jgi:hypothetical protein
MKAPLTLFRNSCVVYPAACDTPQGPTFSASYTTKCRLEARSKTIKTQEGVTYVSSGKAYFPLVDGNDTKIVRGTKLVINSTEYFVKDVFPQAGFSPSHIECNLGDDNTN